MTHIIFKFDIFYILTHFSISEAVLEKTVQPDFSGYFPDVRIFRPDSKVSCCVAYQRPTCIPNFKSLALTVLEIFGLQTDRQSDRHTDQWPKPTFLVSWDHNSSINVKKHIGEILTDYNTFLIYRIRKEKITCCIF